MAADVEKHQCHLNIVFMQMAMRCKCKGFAVPAFRGVVQQVGICIIFHFKTKPTQSVVLVHFAARFCNKTSSCRQSWGCPPNLFDISVCSLMPCMTYYPIITVRNFNQIFILNHGSHPFALVNLGLYVCVIRRRQLNCICYCLRGIPRFERNSFDGSRRR